MIPEDKTKMWSKERLDARASGKTRFDGRVCPRNPEHGTNRLVVNATCFECHQGRSKARAIKNKSAPRRALQLKIDVLNHYGWVCVKCSAQDPDVLTIDHTEQNGAEMRKLRGDNQNHNLLYRWLKRNSFPSNFRTLCYNCNVKAWKVHSGQTFDGRCTELKPHNLHTIVSNAGEKRASSIE